MPSLIVCEGRNKIVDFFLRIIEKLHKKVGDFLNKITAWD
jgi:hypothetical protein